MKYQITKIDAARRQLNTAINIFMEDGDMIAVHTLAHASHKILLNLCEQNKKHISFVSRLKTRVKEDKMGEFIAKINKAGNFFKHADRDATETLDFDPEFNNYWLFDACSMYTALCGDFSIEMHAFLTWFGIEYPQYVLDKNASKLFLDAKNGYKNKKEFMELFRMASVR